MEITNFLGTLAQQLKKIIDTADPPKIIVKKILMFTSISQGKMMFCKREYQLSLI